MLWHHRYLYHRLCFHYTRRPTSLQALLSLPEASLPRYVLALSVLLGPNYSLRYRQRPSTGSWVSSVRFPGTSFVARASFLLYFIRSRQHRRIQGRCQGDYGRIEAVVALKLVVKPCAAEEDRGKKL